MTPINAPEDVLHTAELPIKEKRQREAEQRVTDTPFDHREALLDLRSTPGEQEESRVDGESQAATDVLVLDVIPSKQKHKWAPKLTKVSRADLKMHIFLLSRPKRKAGRYINLENGFSACKKNPLQRDEVEACRARNERSVEGKRGRRPLIGFSS